VLVVIREKNVDAFLTYVCKFFDSCQCVIIVTHDFYPVQCTCILYVTVMSVVALAGGSYIEKSKHATAANHKRRKLPISNNY
jgi:hypothetical protein